MIKIADIIKARNLKISQEEINGLRSRLIFAGIQDDLNEVDASIADDLLDKMIEKMRYSKNEIENYAEQTSTLPRPFKMDVQHKASPQLMVSLVNGRIATFDASNNVVMPVKNSASK